MKKLCKPFVLLLLMGFTLFQTSALQAQRVVTGKVTDTKGNPLEGVTVKFSNSNASSQTDSKGEFTLSISGDGSLIFSSVQHASKTVQLTAGNSYYQVSLTEQSQELTDVVVTGYTSQNRKDISGAVVSVRPADLTIQNTSSPLASAQGLAPGVNITTDGQPGSNPTVLIRGINSLSLRNGPLYIIDGVQTTDLSDFNQNDIESFQVLKDAASTSQYGSRGNAGVIIITTKKGAKGTPKVAYQGYLALQDPLKGANLLDPQGEADLIWFQAKNLALTSGLPYANPSTKQYGNGNAPVLPDYLWYLDRAGYSGPVDLTKYSFPNALIIKANKTGTDWYGELFKPALQQVHNLSVSGGGPNARFYLGLGYFNQPGVLLNTKYERYNITLNSEFTIKKRIRIGESFLFSFANRNGIANQDEGNAVSFSWRIKPIIPVYDASGVNFAGGNEGSLGSAANPVAYRYWAKNDYNHNYNIRFNLYGEVDFLKYFTFKTQLSGTQNFNTYASYRHETYENPENDYVGQLVSYLNGWSQYRSLTYLNTLRFKIDIKENHHINAVVGIEAVSSKGGYLSASNSNYYTDAINYVVLNSGGNVARASGSDPDPNAFGSGNLFSYFGIFQYNYKEKYIVAANLRNDGSSVFSLGNLQYGLFPGVQLAWVVTNEPWLQDNKAISNLKLRASYGQSGNQSIPFQNPFTLFAQSYGSAYYDLSGTGNSLTQGFLLTQIGGPNTTWETKEDLNFGLDLGFINNKLSVTADYFISNSNNLLYQVPLNNTTQGNAAPPYLNTGSVRNSGIELSIGYRNDDHKFKYNIQANLSSYKNEITALTTYGPDYIDAGGWRQGSFVRNQVGNPISSFFGYKVIGFFNTKEEADAENAASGNNEAAIGRYKYADIDGDGKITGDDRTFIGNPNPQFIYGLNVNLSYIGFDLNLQFYGVQGKDVVNYASWWYDGNNFVGAKSKDALYNSWTPTNTNARLPINDGQTSFYTSNVFNSSLVEDGSYLRLKNFTFGYSIPQNLLTKGGIDRVRFYIQASNLFTLTNYRGLDPEFQGVGGNTTAFGIDYGNYRTPVTYTFGVQFGF